MNLKGMTPEQRNKLVHERVMARSADDFVIPDYFRDLDAALSIFDNQGPLVGTHIETWRGGSNQYRCIVQNYPRHFEYTLAFSDRYLAEAVCRAALQALGIIDGKEEVI